MSGATLLRAPAAARAEQGGAVRVLPEGLRVVDLPARRLDRTATTHGTDRPGAARPVPHADAPDDLVTRAVATYGVAERTTGPRPPGPLGPDPTNSEESTTHD